GDFDVEATPEMFPGERVGLDQFVETSGAGDPFGGFESGFGDRLVAAGGESDGFFDAYFFAGGDGEDEGLFDIARFFAGSAGDLKRVFGIGSIDPGAGGLGNPDFG